MTLPNATRTGYDFAGWYTAATGGSLVGTNGASYTPNDNTTLYAHWTGYTVTYNANGGAVSPASDTVDSSGNVTLPTPSWAGHSFDGWYTAASGGTSVGAAGATYSPASSTTIYAHWTAYTVTYDANGGTVSPASASAGADGTVTLATPSVRTGYDFNGWYTATSGGTKIGDAGASYTPTADITVHAQWTIHTHTVSWTTNNSTTNVSLRDGNTSISTGSSVEYDTVVRIDLSYSESGSRDFTVTSGGSNVTLYSDYACTNVKTGTDEDTYYFKMPDDNVTITSTSSWCVTADTLLTLADGSQKRIDELTMNDELLVWNLETGTYDSAPPIFIDDVGPEDYYNVIHLYFSDGTETKIIYEHGYFDYDLGKYVYITESNYRQYIGDRFVKQDDIDNNTWETVTLVDSEIIREMARPYSTNTVNHLCFYVDGMLSMPGGITGLFNIFDVDTSTMTYDFDAMQRDIETYGLYTYEEFESLVSRETFDAVNVAYLKISVGKGLMTEEDIYYLAERYAPFLK